METGTAGGTVTLNEPPSAFDPGRDVKDRKLVQILKRLHMERDLGSLLPFDEDNRRSLEAVSEQSEELNIGKLERCRPRKIMDYALLAKGRSSRNNLVGSFASNYNTETDDTDKNSSADGGKRLRFQKRQYDESISVANPRRRSKIGQASGKANSTRPQRSSFPLAANGSGRKGTTSRCRSFTQAARGSGSILKRNLKQADSVKQAFQISKAALATDCQDFEEFALPEEWIKKSSKLTKKMEKKKMSKLKSETEEGNSGTEGSVSQPSQSIEDMAMERLVRAFKTAKLLYPEKFAKCFPDFMHCFEEEEEHEETKRKKIRRRRNGEVSGSGGAGKRTRARKAEIQGGATVSSGNSARKTGTSDNSSSSDEGNESTPKRTRKTTRGHRNFATGAEMVEKKRPTFAGFRKERKLSDAKEKTPNVAVQKISRASYGGSSSAGVSGLRKRSRMSTDTPPVAAKLLNGNVESAKEEAGDLAETNSKTSATKRRRCSRVGNTGKSPRIPDDKAAVAAIQNNIEDSAAESSSDESGGNNARTSKRQRAQSGFYKTMVTQYDKKRA